MITLEILVVFNRHFLCRDSIQKKPSHGTINMEFFKRLLCCDVHVFFVIKSTLVQIVRYVLLEAEARIKCDIKIRIPNKYLL